MDEREKREREGAREGELERDERHQEAEKAGGLAKGKCSQQVLSPSLEEPLSITRLPVTGNGEARCASRRTRSLTTGKGRLCAQQNYARAARVPTLTSVTPDPLSAQTLMCPPGPGTGCSQDSTGRMLQAQVPGTAGPPHRRCCRTETGAAPGLEREGSGETTWGPLRTPPTPANSDP